MGPVGVVVRNEWRRKFGISNDRLSRKEVDTGQYRESGFSVFCCSFDFLFLFEKI